MHIFNDEVFELICKRKNFDDEIFDLILFKTKTLSHNYNYNYPLYNLVLNKEFEKIDKLLKLGENPLKLNANKLNCIDVTFASGDKQLFVVFKDYIDSYFAKKINYLPPTNLQLNHLLANLKNNSLHNYNLPLINMENKVERLDLFKIIINYEKNFRKVYSPYPGKNAFLIACENEFYELVNYFVFDLNVNVDEFADWLGSTGLILAIENNDYEMVKLLVKCGADVNKGGYMDLKPLFSARKVKDKRIEKFLIESGAK